VWFDADSLSYYALKALKNCNLTVYSLLGPLRYGPSKAENELAILHIPDGGGHFMAVVPERIKKITFWRNSGNEKMRENAKYQRSEIVFGKGVMQKVGLIFKNFDLGGFGLYDKHKVQNTPNQIRMSKEGNFSLYWSALTAKEALITKKSSITVTVEEVKTLVGSLNKSFVKSILKTKNQNPFEDIWKSYTDLAQKLKLRIVIKTIKYEYDERTKERKIFYEGLEAYGDAQWQEITILLCVQKHVDLNGNCSYCGHYQPIISEKIDVEYFQEGGGEILSVDFIKENMVKPCEKAYEQLLVGVAGGR
jgi:hypothetical protein